jgi:hypothetical protein
MLSVIEDATNIDHGRKNGFITLESSCTGPPYQAAFDELNGPGAKEFAIKAANDRGLPGARINGLGESPFPVNRQGKGFDAISQDLPPEHTDRQVHRYRIRVPVMAL